MKIYNENRSRIKCPRCGHPMVILDVEKSIDYHVKYYRCYCTHCDTEDLIKRYTTLYP